MLNTIDSYSQSRWRIVQAIAAGLFIFGYGFQHTNIYLWTTLCNSYIFVAATIFIAFQFFYKGVVAFREAKVLLIFCVWLFITRVLNGDPWLAEDFHLVFENLFLLALFPTAFLLKPSQRRTFLQIIAAGFGIYFAIIAACGIYSALFPVAVGNPFCPEIDVAEFGYGGRLQIFGLHPNITSLIFFIALWLLIYLFFSVKSVAVRILTVIPAVLILCAMSLTYSRNALLAFSVSFSLLISRLVLNLLRNKKRLIQGICFAVVLCLCIVVTYSGCEKIYGLIGTSYEIDNRFGYNSSGLINSLDDKDISVQSDTAQQAADSNLPAASESGTDSTPSAVGRGFEDTGRLPLYWLTFKSALNSGWQLVRGELYDKIMVSVNALLVQNGVPSHSHPHNLFLYALLATGVPGLIIVIVFLCLLLKRMLSLYFSNKPGIRMEHRILLLPLGGIMMYNMLELSLFAYFDIRSIAFVLFAGAVIAYEKELCQTP